MATCCWRWYELGKVCRFKQVDREPPEMLAAERWRQMVEVEHAQSDELRGSVPPPVDHWRPYAAQFRADPRRSGDVLVDHLLEFIGPDDTVMDVGAGGGRLALPIALNCRSLVAVEPSESMAEVLTKQAQASGIANVTVVQNEWQDAVVDTADVVLCAHVLYTIRDICGFLKKLGSHARNTVLVVVHNAPPQRQIYALWKEVHGQERLALPSLPQLREVLEELEISYQVDLMPPQPARGFDTLEQAITQLSRRLYLADGSPEADRLERILPGLLMEEEGVFRIKDSQPLRTALVSWHPTNAP